MRTAILTVMALLGGCSQSGLSIGPDHLDSGGGDGGDLAIIGDPDMGRVCAPETPSRQSVTITVTNGSAGDRWVVTSGQYCDPFSISGVVLSRGYLCGCECPPPPPAAPTYYTHLAAGESLTLSWDARGLEDCSIDIDCSKSWPGAGIIQEPDGRLQPVPPGARAVTVGFERAAPNDPSCRRQAHGDYACSAGFSSPPGTGRGAGPTASLCKTGATAQAAFTLAATGDAAATVTLD